MPPEKRRSPYGPQTPNANPNWRLEHLQRERDAFEHKAKSYQKRAVQVIKQSDDWYKKIKAQMAAQVAAASNAAGQMMTQAVSAGSVNSNADVEYVALSQEVPHA